MSDVAVVALPCLLAAGLVLVFLGVTGARHAPWRPARVVEWLTQAGLRGVAPVHLLGLTAALATVCGLAVFVVTLSAWIALTFGVLGGWLPVLVLRARRNRRLRELQEVWPDAIDHLVSGVRAGLSLPEAVSGLAERGPPTLRVAFIGFAATYQATGRFADAIDLLKDELADPAADRVLEALRMAREVGGTELGHTLRTLSAFLRDEHRVRKELEARQTWVQVAARLAFVMPWLVLLLLALRPEAAAAYRGPGGALVIALGSAMATAGYRLMLRIGRLPREERVLR